MLQLRIIVLMMIRYLALATLILAAAAALYLYFTWPPSSTSYTIYIHEVAPRATVVLQVEGANNER